VISGGDRPERVPASIATANFFSTLGVQPILGRAFRPDEEQGAHDVAIISHGLWQQRFGENPAVVGTSVTIDGRPHIIVGVLPALVDGAADRTHERVGPSRQKPPVIRREARRGAGSATRTA
jgi:hypothetical protein